MGSGTTAIVAKRLGRSFIGFELNKDYIKIALRRLQNAN
jgi:DNA modification methylase